MLESHSELPLEPERTPVVGFGRLSDIDIAKWRDTKFLPDARNLAAEIANTDGWNLNEVEKLIAQHFYDFAVRIVGMSDISHIH